jgi:hypothetical protein
MNRITNAAIEAVVAEYEDCSLVVTVQGRLSVYLAGAELPADARFVFSQSLVRRLVTEHGVRVAKKVLTEMTRSPRKG